MPRLTDEEKAYIVKDHSQLQDLLRTGNLTQIRRILREAAAFHGVPRQLTEDVSKAADMLKLRDVNDSTKRAATLEFLRELLPKLVAAQAEEDRLSGSRSNPIGSGGSSSFNGITYRTPVHGVTLAMKEAKSVLQNMSTVSGITTELVEKIEAELGELRLENNGTVVLTTTEIKLVSEEGTTYSFGEWELHHHSLLKGSRARQQYMEGAALQAIPLRPNYHGNGYPHPHVLRSGGVCMGDASSAIRGALRRGDLFSLFEIWLVILNNYGQESPYARLETWRNLTPTCRRCGKGMKYGEPMVRCKICGMQRCQSCAKQCEDCGEWACNKSNCSVVSTVHFFCRVCRTICEKCEGVFPKAELPEDPSGYRLCLECQRKRLQHTALGLNQRVASYTKERTQWVEQQKKAGLNVELRTNDAGIEEAVIVTEDKEDKEDKEAKPDSVEDEIGPLHVDVRVSTAPRSTPTSQGGPA